MGSVFGSSSKKKIALSKKSVTMTVGQKKTIRIKNAKGKRIKWSIKKKALQVKQKERGKYAVKPTAKKKGTTTLPARKSGKWKSYRCKVKVKRLRLSVRRWQQMVS